MGVALSTECENLPLLLECASRAILSRRKFAHQTFMPVNPLIRVEAEAVVARNQR